MPRICTFAMSLAICTLSTAAPPTKESVQTLLELNQAQAMMDRAHANAEHIIKRDLARAVAGRSLTDDQRRALEAAPVKISELMRNELSWPKLEPIYIGLYQEAFDQAEIDGLVEFYRSPLGKSFVAKMPKVMERSMAAMEVHLQRLMPKVQEAMEQALRDARIQPKT